MSELDRGREEADPAALGRHAQGRRLRPRPGFYENAPAHYAPHVRRAVGRTTTASRRWRPSPGWADFLNWQKDLIDFYGYDKLTRWQAGAGDEFSASNAFERGKIAMTIDGEYRTAFIKDEHPELDYGTAPMPVADAHPELLRRRLRHRQHHRHPARRREQGRRLGAREVPDHRRPRAGDPGQRARATCRRRTASLKSSKLDARPAVQAVPGHLRAPEHARPRRSRRRAAPTRSCSRRSSEVPGRQGRPTSRPGSQDVDKQIDAQVENVRRRRGEVP